MQGDERIHYLERLHSYLVTDFEHAFLNEIFSAFSKPGPLRLNHFSTGLRELIRNVLERMAPDVEVRDCCWSKINDTDRPTRADRMKYSIQGGLSDWYVANELGITVSDVIDELKNKVNDLSKYTHVNEETFGLPDEDVCSVARECLEATLSFFERVKQTREDLIDNLGQSVDKHLVDHLMSETIESVDELSSHHWVEGIDSEEVIVTGIYSKHIKLDVTGSIECCLQWGSSSDVKNDMGAVGNETFPLTAVVVIEFTAPLGKFGQVESYNVDTDSWYQ